jgi:hypothetical protein
MQQRMLPADIRTPLKKQRNIYLNVFGFSNKSLPQQKNRHEKKLKQGYFIP